MAVKMHLVSSCITECQEHVGYGWIGKLLSDDGHEYWSCGYFESEQKALEAAIHEYSIWPGDGSAFYVEVL